MNETMALNLKAKRALNCKTVAFVALCLIAFTSLFYQPSFVKHWSMTGQCDRLSGLIYWKWINMTYVREFDPRNGDAHNSALKKSSAGSVANRFKRLKLMAQEMVTFLDGSKEENNLQNSNEILRELTARKNLLLKELNELSDDIGSTEWRWKEANDLKTLIDKKINEIQNPANCHTVPTLICPMDIPAGFGAGIHEILWCYVIAYYHKRTVVLNATDWAYGSNSTPIPHREAIKLWLKLFKRESRCTESYTNANSMFDRSKNDPVSRQLLSFLPKSIGRRITQLTDEPSAWWFGQFIGYIMRPTKLLTDHLKMTKALIKYKHPVVALHIRRSDKIIKEAAFHSVDEYMFQVEDYFDSIGHNDKERCVFVATDDPKAVTQLRTKYKRYTFISQEHVSDLAEKQETRYSIKSLLGVVTDIFLLAESDFIVCTYSSGICRLAYSLMLYLKPDTLRGAHSLDVPFHYDNIFNPVRVAIYNHTSMSDDEWDLVANATHIYERESSAGRDWWRQAVNKPHFDGHVFGSDYNQSEYKKFPLYKTVREIPLIDD